MKQIWKYKLDYKDAIQQIEVPAYSEFLCIQQQLGTVCLWYLVEPNNEPVVKNIEICMTGSDMADSNRMYLGTCQIHDGFIVAHYFELL